MSHAVTDGFSKDELYRIWVGCFFDITDFGHCAISVCLPLSQGKTNSNFCCWVYYSDFAVEAQSGAGLRPGSTRKKCSKTRCFLPDKELLPKRTSGHILRPLTCPPLQTKVSQAEIEAGDCEGRLPLLFFGGLGSLVFGL